ncbi:cation:proton antiporter domain-containing protein [Actinacidiphila acididurans]|uniref:Cation:proton antiporter n=1 Tax=Actinacidiphila acididurans TaxID=2784346 RepID=A0ABS2U2U1_9ACTN|nr:cation:proton antiporter [Actinacidiphila acididurans]MBM9509914.1 cation:proton antiporter [Actinacidiphila acididurans]
MTTQQTSGLLLALGAIALLAFGAGALARRFRQPPVIGEVLLGVLLGPTLFHGAVANALFPADTRPFLTALADIGVALFMFTVGAELDATLLNGRKVVAGTVASGSIALPFALGSLLALYLFSGHPTGNKTSFVLFMGAAMSVTAFPVLARILVDRGMSRTWLGNIALACAAIDDVLAWTLLAVVVAICGAATGSQWLLLLFIPYLALMVAVVRPGLKRLMSSPRVLGSRQPVPLVVTLVGLLLSAAFTEWIGLHFIFGAFLFGAVMPRGIARTARTEDLSEGIVGQISDLTGIMLLPIYFVVAGLKVNLSGMNGRDFVDLGLILAVAVGGKFLGAYLSARLAGMGTRAATALAVLMNTRGLTELIILTVGLQLGVLDGQLYSSMVVMALVTTALAGPLLQALYPIRTPGAAIEIAADGTRTAVVSTTGLHR